MNGHEVICFAPRFGKAFGKEVIEGGEIFNLPVLAPSYLTEVATQFDEARILFPLHGPLPGQNLVHLV
jgi:hypothetical protein